MASFIILLMGTMFAMVLRQTRAASYRSEALITARQSLELLTKTLDQDFEKTTVDGLHLSKDGTKFSIQTVERISLNGKRAWSPYVTLFYFDQKNRQLLKGQAELSEIGKTHQPDAPADFSDQDLQIFLQTLQKDQRLKTVGNQLDGFSLDRPTSLTARVKLTAVLRSGKYKDETVKTENTFFFAGATNL